MTPTTSRRTSACTCGELAADRAGFGGAGVLLAGASLAACRSGNGAAPDVVASGRHERSHSRGLVGRQCARRAAANVQFDGTNDVICADHVEAPRKLVYTWRLGDEVSLVTVRFEARGQETEVVLVHSEIPSEPVRESHEAGWSGCLDGLARHFGATG